MAGSRWSVVGSCRDGIRRVFAAPAVIAGVFTVTLLAPLPLALAMRGQIEAHLGRSMEAAAAADGANWDWWQEFTSQASGLGTTFTPNVIGFAATLDSLSSVADGQVEILPVTAAIAIYLGGWLFLSGGIIDRYARQRPTRAHGFFSAAGTFFWRLARLAVIAGAIYWLLFGVLHDYLFGDLYVALTRDLASERAALARRVLLYGVFGAFVVLVNVTIDYAKIRLVVEDRRSALGALLAALAFIGRHPGRVLGLYALNALLFLVVIAVWAITAPGTAIGAGLWVWLGLLGSQIYVVARLVLKLQFIASQTALFQSSLAHASYTAAPMPAWPESAAAETIGSA
jgi:hypothetical protein